jgi:transposase InsO family protein
MRKKPKGIRTGKRKRRSTRPFSPEFKLKVVRLFLEEGYSRKLIAEEFNIAESSIGRWARDYRQYGEAGLQPKSHKAPSRCFSPGVREKIVDLKRSNPSYGARRIADTLKRFFLLPASSSSVQRALAQEGFSSKKQTRPQKNPAKPRFFERATANQMWQSDIMTFRLAGRNAYLIGFIDDYSRYITGLGFYRSQTAEHVLEIYRRAISEYGVPKEMLTDNGRQYTNWRGTTRFEKELKKDRVKHIKSRPHHPMTLGKIERFWQTILGEFLQRAQFTSFEEAVERTVFWVKYYNYKRPHQGIGGLCPADRFFEIQHALKETLAQGIEENALELALRGKPRDPFYMVGRMGDQSVVIRAEKGKVKMLVDGADNRHEKELVYDAGKDIKNEENQSTELQSAGQGNGRTVGMDRTADEYPDMQRAVHQLSPVEPVAEPGNGRNGNCPEPKETGGTGSPEHPINPAYGEEYAGSDHQTGEAPAGSAEIIKSRYIVNWDKSHVEIGSNPGSSPEESRDYHESSVWTDDSLSGGGGIGDLTEDLLSMGATGSCRSVERGVGETSRSTGEPEAGRSFSREDACRCLTGEQSSATEVEIEGFGHGHKAPTRFGPDGKKMIGS